MDHGYQSSVDPGDETSRKGYLCELVYRDRVPATSRMAAGELGAKPIWVLEVVTQRQDMIGVLIFRGDKVSILTKDELNRE